MQALPLIETQQDESGGRTMLTIQAAFTRAIIYIWAAPLVLAWFLTGRIR